MVMSKRWTRYAEDSHRCPQRGVEKPSGDFYRDASKSNGRRFICKACDLARSRRYYVEHREAKLAKANARNAARRSIEAA